MALIGHWPLNGNTNDISGYSNNGIPTNITYTNGKIGQAGTFSGTSSWIALPVNPINDLFSSYTQWTVSFWVKATPDSNFMYYIHKGVDESIGNSTIFIGTLDTNYISFSINGLYNTSGLTTYSMPSNIWKHLTMSYNNGIVKGYVDGVKIHEYTALLSKSLAPGFGVGNSVINQSTRYLTGQMNDLRFFNHALTDMEVQELARAKILHYTFDDMQEPTTNEANTDVARTLFNHSSSTGTVMTLSDAPERGPGWKKAIITARSSSNFRLAQFPYINHSINTTKTYSVEFDFGATTGYYWRIDGYSMGGVESIVGNRFSSLYSTTTNSGDLAIFLNHNITGATGLNDIIYYRYYQVEEKSYATEFTEGTRTARVNDYSGFFNHSYPLTETNTPRWTPDSKIGTGAYEFSNKKITGPGPFHISSDRLTLYAWVKPTGTHSDDRGIVIQQNGNYYLTVTPTQQVSVFWYDTSNPGYHTTTETLTLNQWSHIASVWNGTHNLIYINGLLVKTTATNTPGRTIGSSPLTIGRETANRQFIGYIDDVRQYATALSDKDIKDLYEARAEIEEGGVLYARDFLSNVEETVNLVTNKLNSYPSTGNSWGTYDADSSGIYNNGTAYSIGNIVSVVDNIVTVDGTGKALYTYDSIYPVTTGGGLTASTNYFIKKHAANQYSFHTYNGSQDGSQAYINSETGKYQVHYSVDTDTRIAINSTNFPTSWKGAPHNPNQSLVKQIVSNGFNYKGRVHDCIRLITSFRLPDPIHSYMAYGGGSPVVVAGRTYTISFYIRAINSIGVGRWFNLTLWTSGSWSGGNYAYALTLSREWQRYEMTAIAPNSGSTSLYFRVEYVGVDMEIAEIQFEEKPHATPFTSTYRPAIELPATLDFAGNEVHETGTANFEDFSTVGITDGLIGYWQLDKDVKDYSGNNYNGTVVGSVPLIGDYLSFDGAITNYVQLPNALINNMTDFSFAFKIRFTNIAKSLNTVFHASTGGNNALSLEFRNTYFRTFINDSALTEIPHTPSNNIDYHFVVRRSGSTVSLYENGILVGSQTTVSTPVTISGAIVLGQEQDAVLGALDATQSFEGRLYNLKVFNRALTAEEIAIEYNTMFNNEVQIHESGTVYAKDIVQY